MFCSNCGAEATGKFCSNCGQPLPSAAPKPVSDTKEWTPAPHDIPDKIVSEPVQQPVTNTEDIRFSKVDESIKRRSESSVAQMEQRYPKDNPAGQTSAPALTPANHNAAPADRQVQKTVVKKSAGGSDGSSRSGSGKSRTKTQHKTKVSRRRGFSVTSLLGSGISNILRYISIACMAALTLYTAAGFWSERNALGNLLSIREESNYAMYIYVGLGLFFVIFGALSCLWIYSRRRMADGRKMRRYDTGRGLVPFLLFGLISFFASAIIVRLPASPDFLRGAAMALQVFFVHRNMNLVFSAVGVVCSILRGIKFH